MFDFLEAYQSARHPPLLLFVGSIFTSQLNFRLFDQFVGLFGDEAADNREWDNSWPQDAQLVTANSRNDPKISSIISYLSNAA